jgi:hypothetical protein
MHSHGISYGKAAVCLPHHQVVFVIFWLQVREGRPLPAVRHDMLLASSLVDTPMPQAAAEMPGAAAAVMAAAASAPGMGMMVDANLGSASAMQGVQVVQPLNGAAMTSSQAAQPAGSVGGPPAATVSSQQLQQQGPGVMRSMDSFSSAVNDPAGSRAAAAAAAAAACMGACVSVGAAPQPGMQHTMQLQHPGIPAGAGSGALFGSVTSLQGMTGREGSLDGSGLGTLVTPAPPSAPAVPTPSHGVPDAAMMAAAAASSLGTSPGMGPSPALTKSGMDDAAAAVAAAAAAQQQQAAAAAAAAAAAVAVPVPGVVPAAVPGMPAMSMGLPTAIVTSSQPLATSQALSSGGGAGLPAVVSAAACDMVGSCACVEAMHQLTAEFHDITCVVYRLHRTCTHYDTCHVVLQHSI